MESEDYKIRENGITATKPEVGAIRYPPASSVIFSESFPHSPLLSPGLQGMLIMLKKFFFEENFKMVGENYLMKKKFMSVRLF